MMPGPFDICVLEPQEDSDGVDYRTLSFGYDTLTQAMEACEGVAKEHGVDLDDLVVVSAIAHSEWKESGAEAWAWVKDGMK